MRHKHKYLAIFSIYYKKSTYKRIIYKQWNKFEIKNKTEQFGFSNAKSEIIIVIISSNK